MATTSPIATSPVLDSTMTAGRLDLVAGGAWTAAHAEVLERLIDGIAPQVAGASQVFLDIGKVDALDTIGAWLLERLVRRPDRDGKKAELRGVSPRYHGLIEEMHAVNLEPRAPAKAWNPVLAALESIGRAAAGTVTDINMFLGMLGEFAAALGRVLVHPRRFRLTSTVHHLDRVGWQAVPIMVLITFLIGGIIAQQGIFHFRKVRRRSLCRRHGRHPGAARDRRADRLDHGRRPLGQLLHRRTRLHEDARGDRRARAPWASIRSRS